MSSLVLDTHAIIWYLEKSSRLTEAASGAIRTALGAKSILYVSPISLAEILYLDEKGRIHAGTLDKVLAEMKRPDSGLIEAPITANVVEAMRNIPRDGIPELPDRMIAATAVHLGLPLVTADLQIRAANIATIW